MEKRITGAVVATTLDRVRIGGEGLYGQKPRFVQHFRLEGQADDVGTGARRSLTSYRELCTPSLLNSDACHVLQPWHRQQGQVGPPRASTKTFRQWRVDLALRVAHACVACLHVVEERLGDKLFSVHCRRPLCRVCANLQLANSSGWPGIGDSPTGSDLSSQAAAISVP